MMFRRFVVLMAATLPMAVAADIRVVEEIAAKVNGDIVTRGQLEQAKRDTELELKGQGMTGVKLTDALNQVTSNGLRDQIDQLLLVQKGKDLNINVDSEVNRRLAALQVQSRFVDPDKFHDYIRQETGMTYEDYRDMMKRRLLSERVIGQEISYRITFPENELRKYYDEHQSEYVRKEQVFLSQILISTEGKTPQQAAAAEAKAKDIVVRARKGEKFAELVAANSDDTETAKNGGQLPPRERGMSIPEIEKIIFTAKKGDVTDPIKLAQGFVILRIDERYEAGQAPFEEVKNEIQEKMAAPKMEPKIREYLTRLREDAFLQIKDGYVDSGAAPGKDTRWMDVAQLKPQTTTKEEVAARTKRHKKILFIPIPGTNQKAPAATTTPATTPAVPAAEPAKPTPPTEPTAPPIKQ